MTEGTELDEITRFKERSEDDDVDELQWAAVEKLQKQTHTTLNLIHDRTQHSVDGSKESAQGKKGEIHHLAMLKSAQERRAFIDKLLKKIEEDNYKLLLKQRERMDRVGVEIPTVEIRYKNLSVEAEYEANQQNPLPTLWNTFKQVFSRIRKNIGIKSHAMKMYILQDLSGIIRPSKMTLLLGPPGCGKTTLLLALAGKLDKSLKVTADISYNGYKFNEFDSHKTSAYISQYDRHISELTVRETLDFAARCQGVGDRAERMAEVTRREKQAGIVPEPDIDTYMKATSIKGLSRNLQTDYILKILGLDICADTIVGDAMRRGISGGQKKRLTTGEMISGPSRVLLMDEISNGLDSSTTFQIVTCLQQLAYFAGYTIVVSLLQPAPETFCLFDDIVLIAEGKTVYHGPRNSVLDFFEECGFRCPPRKGIADFLQEVVSEKDQAQYWLYEDKPATYIPPEEFARQFKRFHIGKKLDDDLSQPIHKAAPGDSALSFTKVSSPRNWQIFKACIAREWLLMKRNSFLYAFKAAQLMVAAFITMTVFLRTQTKIDDAGANYFLSSLFYSLIRMTTQALPELPMTVSRLSIFYKQRDSYFYPAWAYSIPAAILKVPFSLLDAFIWCALTYYVIGYSPEPERFFRQLLLMFILNQVSVAAFRLIASIYPDQSLATFFGLFYLIASFLFCGFIVPRSSLPKWLEWGFWLSPLTYAELGISVNEFLAPRWQKVSYSNATIGKQLLRNHGLNYSGSIYWNSVIALVAFGIFLISGFTCILSFSKAPRRSRSAVQHKNISGIRLKTKGDKVPEEDRGSVTDSIKAPEGEKQMVMALPFKPMAVTFENVQYYVDTPKKMRAKGFAEKKLQLLQDITGSFRPGILTALMGVTGAGKTTLLDVLSGRKSSGITEGDIRIGGYPKIQSTYARISDYSTNIYIHIYATYMTIIFTQIIIMEFVTEVLQMIELEDIQDSIVGIPGVSGISFEQRKRLTIAVELVSNPSILFMDEPTSGLDARAAAIVMRVVKNIVRTKRTVVCTIHQPSIDIFEAFDELILMKRGGQIIYSGELGQHSSKLIEYFENIPGVPKIQENYNPATWMLEVSSLTAEARHEIDLSKLYKESSLCWKTKVRARELHSPGRGSEELQFPTRFMQNEWEQFKACLWKQNLSYWRSPKYNLARLTFVTVASFLLGAILWGKGKEINDEQDLYNIVGSLFIFQQFLGIGNCNSILSLIATERSVVYRERFAGMYSSWTYSLAQVIVEIPYIFLQSCIFIIITYPAIGFYWSVAKGFWYLYTMFCTMLYYTYIGMMFVSMTRSFQVASVTSSFFNTMTALLSGFLIPEPQMPKWWVWCYWILPTSWSLRSFITTQYGDVDKEIGVLGEKKATNAFLESYYGYRSGDTCLVAIVLAAFPFAFASLFIYFSAKLNFQRR
nr:PREDICTED: pleiotropic drug resistance protein 3-like [Daucus carota subsp. sativus]